MVSASSRGAYGVIFASLFVALSAWAVREMRIGPISKQLDDPIFNLANSKIIKEYNNTELRYEYTGIKQVDFGLRFLVIAFLPGVLGIDAGQRLQQWYFLLSFFPVIAVFAIEAGRKRNAWSLIYFTSIWALLYQTIGGAIIIPLYHLSYLWKSSKAEYWTPASREVPLSYAKALLPSLLIGYLLPTVLLYRTYENVSITQGYIAFWQPAPIFVNVLLMGIGVTYALEQSAENKAVVKDPTEPLTTLDVKYLNRVYIVTFLVAAMTHWAAIGTLITSDDPNMTFSHAILPSYDLFANGSRVTVSEGLLYIFQMDFWIIGISTIAWCFLNVLDVNRISGKAVIRLPKAIVVVLFNSLVFGPGATLSAVWYWREQALTRKSKTV